MNKRASSPKQTETTGRFAYDGLERVIHEKARLGIMTSLVAHPQGLTFADLKQLCELTDGNLNRHLKVLEEAELVTVSKGAEGRRPQTRCQLTKQGQKKFVEYLEELERVIADAATAQQAAKQQKPSAGWSTA